MFNTPLYPRGFAFYPCEAVTENSLPAAAYSRHRLPGGAALDVDELTDLDLVRDGEDWTAVVGSAFLYDADTGEAATTGNAAELLASAQADPELSSVEGLLYDMGGRHCVIVHVQGRTRIYHDAHGVRTVYWRTDTGVVASHYDFLERLAEKSPNPHPLSRLTIGGRWEHTDDVNIRALLPNYRLELEEGRERRFFPLRENPFRSWSEEDKAREVRRIWHAQMDAVLSMGRPNVASVTAGIDSRLLLSFLRGREEHFDTFTYGPPPGTAQDTRFNQILSLDIERATGIAETIGLRHRLLHPDRQKLELLDLEVLDRNSIHLHGRWLLPLYLEHFPDPRTMFCRGNLVETVRAHLNVPVGKDWRRPVEKFLLARSPSKLSAEDLALCTEATRREILRFEDPVIADDYEIVDLAYWEVRMGRFTSEMANETDVAFDVWMPINQRRIMDLLLSFPRADRSDETSMFSVIGQEHPVLNGIDINEFPSMETRARLYEMEGELAEKALGRNADRQAWHSPNGEEVFQTASSTLMLESDTFVAGSFVQREWNFESEEGSACVVFRNRWTSAKGEGYISIECGVGDQTLQRIDVSRSGITEVFETPVVKRGEKIWIRLVPQRTVPAESWSKASRTEILSYSESRT